LFFYIFFLFINGSIYFALEDLIDTEESDELV